MRFDRFSNFGTEPLPVGYIPPPPLSSQNIESKRTGKTLPRKIFHRKELEVKIFHSKDLREKILPVFGLSASRSNQVVRNSAPFWQLTTGYWQLLFKELPSPHTGCERRRHTTSSAPVSTNTKPGLGPASAQITLACDKARRTQAYEAVVWQYALLGEHS